MSKSIKIVIGIFIALLIIWGGFELLMKPNVKKGSLFSPENPSQNASGLERILRPLMH